MYHVYIYIQNYIHKFIYIFIDINYIHKFIYIFIDISYILLFFDLIKLIKLQAKKLINIIYQFIFLK